MRLARHTITFVTPGDTTVDAEGRATVTTTSSTRVRGFVGTLSAREVAAAAQRGMTVDVAMQVPRGTVVDKDADATVEGAGLLDGTYRVEAVTESPLTVRVLARRVEM